MEDALVRPILWEGKEMVPGEDDSQPMVITAEEIIVVFAAY